MSEMAFQRQVLDKLEIMDKRISHIMEYIEDSKLSDEERQLLEKSHKHEREGRLISSKELAKKLRL